MIMNALSYLLKNAGLSHRDLVLPDVGEDGPSREASPEIRMASSIAASNPLPPSPRRAGPKHSGRRISRRTTTLAFSSTLSPEGNNKVKKAKINEVRAEKAYM